MFILDQYYLAIWFYKKKFKELVFDLLMMHWESIFKAHFPLLKSVYISNVNLQSLLFILKLETYFACIEGVRLGVGLTTEG